MRIDGIAAVVTGGGSGLGRATAEALAAAGARVSVLDLDDRNGEAVASGIGGTYHRVDVSDDALVAEAFASAQEVNGTARILVNCAGIASALKTVGKDGTPHPIETFRRTVEINLIGTFNVAARFAAMLAHTNEIDGERGVIINTASVAAFDGQIGQTAYGASKGGVAAMTLPMARDLADLRIRVMTIAPGIFLTPMLASLPQHVQDTLGAQVPHPSRLGAPGEFAMLVEAIVRNPMLNGETIRLDGAIRMAPR